MGAAPDDLIRGFTGSIVASFVSTDLRPEGTSLADLIRCARVLAVDNVTPDAGDPEPCVRCAEPARFRVVVEWEAGFTSPDGNVLCEHCTIGRVTQGAEWVTFGDDEPPAETVGYSLTIPLRPDRDPS